MVLVALNLKYVAPLIVSHDCLLSRRWQRKSVMEMVAVWYQCLFMCLPLGYEGTTLHWIYQTRQSINLFDIHVLCVCMCVCVRRACVCSLNKCAVTFMYTLYSRTFLQKLPTYLQKNFLYFDFHTHVPACCHTPHTDCYFPVIMTSFLVISEPTAL